MKQPLCSNTDDGECPSFALNGTSNCLQHTEETGLYDPVDIGYRPGGLEATGPPLLLLALAATQAVGFARETERVIGESLRKLGEQVQVAGFTGTVAEEPDVLSDASRAAIRDAVADGRSGAGWMRQRAGDGHRMRVVNAPVGPRRHLPGGPRSLTTAVTLPTVEHVSEEVDRLGVPRWRTHAPEYWRIGLRDDILVTMIGSTNPDPDWAVGEAERDWYLARARRPREDYTVALVPGPFTRALADEQARRKRLWDDHQANLRAERGEP